MVQLKHKIKNLEGIKDSTIRPITSNIRTATYETAEYLNTLLTPLAKSNCNIFNTEMFIQEIRKEKIPDECKIILFDIIIVRALTSFHFNAF